MLSLKEKYIKEVIPKMKEAFGYKNDLAVPRLVKVIINTGFNPGSKNEKAQKEMAQDLALITGQKSVVRQARKAEAGFNIKAGMPIGLMVSLRKQRMYDFLDRLIHIALPRSRDFRGLAKTNVDTNGNLNIGIREQIIFPEISAESAKSIFGFQITVVTTAPDRKQGLELFKLLGLPFK